MKIYKIRQLLEDWFGNLRPLKNNKERKQYMVAAEKRRND